MATSRKILVIIAPVPQIGIVHVTLHRTYWRWRKVVGLCSVCIESRYELLAADNLADEPFLHASVPAVLAFLNRTQLILASSLGG